MPAFGISDLAAGQIIRATQNSWEWESFWRGQCQSEWLRIGIVTSGSQCLDWP